VEAISRRGKKTTDFHRQIFEIKEFPGIPWDSLSQFFLLLISILSV
jgi:hypothetical protein